MAEEYTLCIWEQDWPFPNDKENTTLDSVSLFNQEMKNHL